MNKLKLDAEIIVSVLMSIFVFLLMVDPANTLLGIKDVFFIFFVFISAVVFRKIDIRFLIVVILIYAMMALTCLRGWIAGYQFDTSFTLHMFKTFFPLILCFWASKYRVIEKLTLPALVISLATLFVSIILIFFPELLDLVYDVLATRTELMMISRRSYLGHEITSAYYRSLPLLIIPAAIYLHKFFFEKQFNYRYGLVAFVFLFALFFGGMRASMLSAILLLCIFWFKYLSYKKNAFILLIPLFASVLIVFSIVLYALLNDTSEASIHVKYGHLESLVSVFRNDPMILLFGSGAGRTFYSIGSGTVVPQVEWTYFEFIRMFGLFGGMLLLSFYYLPLLLIYNKRRQLQYSFPIMWGYFFYLLIGATNPLLIGSNGMLAVLVAYSYALNKTYETKNISDYRSLQSRFV